jgi:hypothetical protein
MGIHKASKAFLLLSMAGLFFSAPALAQWNLGLDIASRYVWRGFEFGNSPSLQPELSYSSGGLEVGVWGAFATSGDPEGTEVDLFASYTFETSAGDFSLIVTDYTFPVHHSGAAGSQTWFDSDAHYVEVGLGYQGPESFPVSIFAGMFVHNDDDNSVYLELGYEVGEFGLFLGMTPMESAAYETTGPGIINMGLGTSRTIKVTDTFDFDLTSALSVNPYAENLFFVVGISF